MKSQRKPDFILKAMNRANGDKSSRLGAAWKNDNGTITIIMDLGCHLTYNKDVTTTLFPPACVGEYAETKTKLEPETEP